jgi:hypothetical protein
MNGLRRVLPSAASRHLLSLSSGRRQRRWCSSGVAAILEGVPLMVDDRSAVTYDVSHHGVDVITSPRLLDRQQWLWDLSAAHWSDEESRQGLVWQKFLPYMR